MKPLLFKNRADWRRWLEENHANASEVWLVYYKVSARKNGKESVSYEDAVQEALCFGWIDSTVRRIDDEKHMQRFTPRKPKSIWSASNKARVDKLSKSGQMHEAGLKAIEVARKNGSWNTLENIDKINQSSTDDSAVVPGELLTALRKIPGAESRFNALAPSRKKQLIWWVTTAKREETRDKRIAEIVKSIKPTP